MATTKDVGEMSAAEQLLHDYELIIGGIASVQHRKKGPELRARILSLLESGQRADRLEKALQDMISLSQHFIEYTWEAPDTVRPYRMRLAAAREALRKEG